jgi:dTDP-4-dehydrorhamnose 3,5-epimerase-like enzyme
MNITDVKWINLRSVCDDRGCLTAIEGEQMIPFEIKRVFYMHNVFKGANRGGHAHHDTDQFAVAVHGSLKIIVSDGHESRTVILDNPGWGITLPRMTWTSLLDFSDGAVCMVLASTHYDRSKSIRTWAEYLDIRGVSPRPEVTTGLILENHAIGSNVL